MSKYDKDLIKAYNFGNYSRTIKNQIDLIKLKMKKKLQFSIHGGSFELTSDFIVYVKSYADQGVYRAIFLDQFENPVQVDNVEEFYDKVHSIRRNVLNEFYEEFEKLRKTRNLTDMLDE